MTQSHCYAHFKGCTPIRLDWKYFTAAVTGLLHLPYICIASHCSSSIHRTAPKMHQTALIITRLMQSTSCSWARSQRSSSQTAAIIHAFLSQQVNALGIMHLTIHKGWKESGTARWPQPAEDTHYKRHWFLFIQHSA